MPGVIRLQTEIPGPNSRALLARRAKAVPRGRAGGDPDRRRARRGRRADRRRRQPADRLRRRHRRGQHRPSASRGGRGGAGAARPVRPRLLPGLAPTSRTSSWPSGSTGITPGTHEKRTFFVNSGAEAVENAVKVARHFTGRQAVICFEHGFHGRTNLAMALTSKVMPYKKGFGPFAPEVYRIPYPYCYRCAEGPAAGPLLHGRRRRGWSRSSPATVDPGLGGRRHHGARAGRGRVRAGAGRVRPDARRLREAARHPVHRRRDPDRLRPHRASCSPASTTGWCPI